MAAFDSLDRRLRRDLQDLHDHLWAAKQGDLDSRIAALARDARGLDTFLGAQGRLRRNADRLASPRGRATNGTALYELLNDAYHLTAATERIRAKDYRRTAEHVSLAVESMSIGLCASADRYDIVERWESTRETSFEGYAAEIADLVEGQGFRRAGEYKRMLVAARNAGADWDASVPRAMQALAARAAVTNGAWVGVATGIVRRSIGVPRAFPESDYAAILERILRRL